MRGLTGLLLVLSFMMVSGTVPALAQQDAGEVTVYVVAASHVRAGDPSAGREEAINTGLITAVSRVLMDMLAPEVMVGGFQAINEAVLSHADQFVRDYKVMTTATTGDTYRIMLQATVAAGRLKKTLSAAGVRLVPAHYPSVLVCVAEKEIGDLAPRTWWSGQPEYENLPAAKIAQTLSAAGFSLVEPARNLNLNYPTELSVPEALDLGRRLGAEVVVLGAARAQQALGGDERPVAEVSLAAYAVADGALIAQTERKELAVAGEPYASGKEALASAAAQAAEDMAARIGNAWMKQEAAGTRVQVEVQNINGKIAQFVKFRGALSTAAGVESLEMKEMKPDTAVLAVGYHGSAQALADTLQLFTFSNFSINILQVEAGLIRLQLVQK